MGNKSAIDYGKHKFWPKPVEGKVGKAMRFDGKDDRLGYTMTYIRSCTFL